MSHELYKKYRPQRIKEVYGNAGAKAQLVGFIRAGQLPHFLLFTGPSGTGKTTLARITANGLKCAGNDYMEMNAASTNGVDMVRDLQGRQGLAPMCSPCRVIVVDECHQLTKQAQEAFLKTLEDTPGHVYYFFCTTDTGKLLPTIRTRATQIKVEALNPMEVAALVRGVAQAEGKVVDEEVIEKIADTADGSPRMALVLLGQALTQTEPALQLAAISRPETEVAAFEIARALQQGKPWGTIAPLLKKVTDDPETVRRIIGSYFATVTMGATQNPAKPAAILDLFCPHWYDNPKACMGNTIYKATKV